MDATAIEIAIAQEEFEREQAELLRIAAEKPTLRMIDASQPLPITEWQERYPEQALLIEVTKEDFSQVYEGKLIATAKNSVEFIDLDKRGLVTLTAYGVMPGNENVAVVATPFMVTDEGF